MKLYIKNMVCNRCKILVKAELDKLGVQYSTIELGEVNTKVKMTPSQRIGLNLALKHSGFELINEEGNALIEKLKGAITDLEHFSNEDLKTNFSDYISLIVNDNFVSLNSLFAEIKGITIEKFIIRNKVELVKELLIYDEIKLADIAIKMHYSNVAQLSSQFKRITGLTPTNFRQLKHSISSNTAIN